MSSAETLRAGIDNLLFNCIEAKPGDSLAIVSEQGRDDHYSATLDKVIEAHARNRSLDVTIVAAPFGENASNFPAHIREAIESNDHTLFLARIGDQLRFSEHGYGGNLTMCYALDEQSFASAFCSAHYKFFVSLKSLINAALFGEKQIVITCPSGTRLEGISPLDPADDNVDDVTIRRFPMTVFRPIPANTFSGRLALSRWLCPTGSRFYAPNCVLIDGIVFALVENGRIVDFEGKEREVRKIREHYDFVADKFGIEGDVIHSWHAGFHPQNGYNGLAIDNLSRWSSTAFGNPRYLHLHTCGDYAPGEICASVFDPTITVEGVDFWRNGRLKFENTPAVRSLEANYAGMRELFEHPLLEFGLGDRLGNEKSA